MEGLHQHLIDAWLDKIAARMRANGAASVQFKSDIDFNLEEMEWICFKLVPALEEKGLRCNVRPLARPGEGNSCDCTTTHCVHASGRILVVALR